MQRVLMLSLVIGSFGSACGGADPQGRELATLQVGVQGLYENSAEIDLPAGPTDVEASAVAQADIIKVTVNVLQAGVLIATLPLDIPNATPKIPVGDSAKATGRLTLSVGVTSKLNLGLVFGAAAGKAADAGLDMTFTISQDSPAPTINNFMIIPGPTYTASQKFRLDVNATNNVGPTSELTVSGTIVDASGKSVGSAVNWTFASGRFSADVVAPAVLGSYTLEIRVQDRRPATTLDSKTIFVTK